MKEVILGFLQRRQSLLIATLYISHLFLIAILWGNYYYYPILQIRKLRNRQVKELIQGYPGSKGQSWDSSLSSLVLSLCSQPLHYMVFLRPCGIRAGFWRHPKPKFFFSYYSVFSVWGFILWYRMLWASWGSSLNEGYFCIFLSSDCTVENSWISIFLS